MSTLNALVQAPSFTPARHAKTPLRAKVGYAVSLLPCAMVFAAGCFKAFGPMSAGMAAGMKHLGIEPALARPLGVLEIAVALLCAIPQTAFLGAILFTGWAGGAILTHLRVGEPPVVQAVMAVLVWIGLGLRRPDEFASLLGVRR